MDAYKALPRPLITLSAAGILLALAGAAAFAPQQETTKQVVAAPAKIQAYFVYPMADVQQNENLLRTMKADAITFGYRVLPADKSSFPAQVRSLIGNRKAYTYTGSIDWSNVALRSGDRHVTIAGTRWSVIDTRNGTVVVTKGGADAQKALNAAGNRLGAKTIIGLPAPKAGSQNGVAWLPDTSYLGPLSEFTKRFVLNSRAQGADGFYQHIEMPVTDTAHWAPVRNLYARQNAAVNAGWAGAHVVISPFLESRTSKSSFTPAQAGRGAKMLLDTANGTNLTIAVQDGLGVGTTALWADQRKGDVAPLEHYLKAMHATIGSHLWTNIELMKPGKDNTRLPTTKKRVSQQLWTEAQHVDGVIAFMWNDSTRGIGAKYVPGGITNWSNGFGTTAR